MAIRRYADALVLAPAQRTSLIAVKATVSKNAAAPLAVEGPGDGRPLSLCLVLDGEAFVNAGIELVIGWEISEDGGQSWQMLAQSTSPGGLMPDGKDQLEYRHLFVHSRPTKPFSFLARPFIKSSGGDVDFANVSYWTE